MPTLTNLVVNLSGDSSKLNKAVDKARRNLKKLGGQIGKAAKVSGIAGAALGGVAVAGLIRYGKKSAAAIDETAKLAKAMGISESEVKALGLAADLSGVPFKSMQTAMKTSLKGADEFARGISESKGLKQSFDDAGLSADEVGEILKTGPTKSFGTLLNAINQIQDPIKRLNAAQNLLGKRNTNVVNSAQLLGTELQKQVEFVDFYRGSTSKLSRDIENMNDQFSVTSTALSLIGERFTVAAAGPIQQATAAFQEWLGKMIAAEGGVDNFVNNVLEKLGTKLKELQPVAEGFAQVFGFLSDTAGKIVDVGTGLGKISAAGGGKAAFGLSPGLGENKESIKKQEEVRAAVEEQTQLLRKKLKGQGFGPEALGFGP